LTRCSCSSVKSRSLPFDRVSRQGAGRQAILYFNPEDAATQSSGLIACLDRRAENDPEFSYIIRYRPSHGREQGPKSKMAGYGVELALKKTDYLVVDDRDTGSASSADSQIQSSNATLASGTFEDILGIDPWAELSTPLSKFEVMGTFSQHNFN
jgi:UDP-glucose:glycoprotein glucosyltransferase